MQTPIGTNATVQPTTLFAQISPQLRNADRLSRRSVLIPDYSFVKLFAVIQRNNDNFRSVIDPQRNDTVAYSPANDHGGVIFSENACIIFWEETLIRSNQASNEWQAELSAVCMAREYQIHSSIDIEIKQLRPVR